ncbi:MAG: hypothetical protein Q9223_007626 [Gallowayella weberi]
MKGFNYVRAHLHRCLRSHARHWYTSLDDLTKKRLGSPANDLRDWEKALRAKFGPQRKKSVRFVEPPPQPPAIPLVSKPAVLKCKRCPEIFSSNTKLHAHIAAHHTKKSAEKSPALPSAPQISYPLVTAAPAPSIIETSPQIAPVPAPTIAKKPATWVSVFDAVPGLRSLLDDPLPKIAPVNKRTPAKTASPSPDTSAPASAPPVEKTPLPPAKTASPPPETAPVSPPAPTPVPAPVMEKTPLLLAKLASPSPKTPAPTPPTPAEKPAQSAVKLAAPSPSPIYLPPHK